MQRALYVFFQRYDKRSQCSELVGSNEGRVVCEDVNSMDLDLGRLDSVLIETCSDSDKSPSKIVPSLLREVKESGRSESSLLFRMDGRLV